MILSLIKSLVFDVVTWLLSIRPLLFWVGEIILEGKRFVNFELRELGTLILKPILCILIFLDNFLLPYIHIVLYLVLFHAGWKHLTALRIVIECSGRWFNIIINNLNFDLWSIKLPLALLVIYYHRFVFGSGAFHTFILLQYPFDFILIHVGWKNFLEWIILF